ncbi:MAG: helicase-exonuclease AddAB subunit AddB [Lachnospiraceae bacterium]|nr:helicase-exonuclease AddAB subunit AddB [Lachnospiraceae bacterium]
MSLRFLTGAAGSGKSTVLFRELIAGSLEEPGRARFMLVPEQFTLEAQADLVRLHPCHGTMDLDIVSFERLAFRVFEETGVPMPVLLDDMGKLLVLRKVASKHAEELGIFRKNLKKAGFLEELKSVLSEFCQYRVGPEKLEELCGHFEKKPMLQEKLKSLNRLYRAFNDELNANTVPKEELLHVFCRYIPGSELLRGSVIGLDGFTGFTPVQYEVLRLLLRVGAEVTVTLTTEDGAAEGKAGEEDLFYLSRKTAETLLRIAGEEGAGVLPEQRLSRRPPVRFQNAPALAALEQNFGRFPVESYAGETGAVRIREAADPAAEAEQIAREIGRLVREEGLRYREIAVVAGSLDAYRHALKEAFARNRIPGFLDSSRRLIQNPLSSFVLGLLEVAEKGMDYEPVFRCLKSGFLTENNGAVDRVENYVLSRGIRGKTAWRREWIDEKYARLEEEKNEVAGSLIDFYERMKAKDLTVSDRLEILSEFLSKEGAGDIMERLKERFEETGDVGAAKEYEQAGDLMDGLFEKIRGIMGGETLPLKEFREILTTGMEETKVGVLPAGMDQVLVGDMTRSRLKDIRVLFFAGMNDGIVPAKDNGGGVLSELEREQLKEAGAELKPTVRENSFIQKFYLYLAFTKPDRQLILSYSRMDGQGKSLLSSAYLRQVEKIFPSVKREAAAETEEDLAGITTRETARRILAEGLRPYLDRGDSGVFRKLYEWFLSREEERPFVEFLKEAGFYRYEEDSIGAAAAFALYGGELSGSVTRLEQYAACAYAWFLQAGLCLTERRIRRFEARDMGSLLHAVLEKYIRRMRKEGFGWDLAEEVQKKTVSDCVEEALSENGREFLEEDARGRYLTERLKRIAQRTVWALSEQGKKGDFRPESVETVFSAYDTKAMNLWLNERDILRLKGKIDRIDVCEDGETCYVKIIDYKSGAKKFDLAAVYYGLQLQLLLYLDAAMETEKRKHPDKRIVPAGVFYYHIDDPLVDAEPGEGEEAIRERILETLRMSGLSHKNADVIRRMERELEGKSRILPVTLKDGVPDSRSSVADSEQFARLGSHVRSQIRKMGLAMLRGEVPAQPYKKGDETGCDYCMFRPVCGFDTKIGGYRYRKLPKTDVSDIWERLEKTGEEA